MMTNIKRMLGIGTPDPKRGNTIVVNAEKLERRVALLEEGVLEEYSVEREGDQNIVGGIFKGRVKRKERRSTHIPVAHVSLSDNRISICDNQAQCFCNFFIHIVIFFD